MASSTILVQGKQDLDEELSKGQKGSSNQDRSQEQEAIKAAVAKQRLNMIANEQQVPVEQLHYPPYEIADNTDDFEPQPANIVYAQSDGVQRTPTKLQLRGQRKLSDLSQRTQQQLQLNQSHYSQQKRDYGNILGMLSYQGCSVQDIEQNRDDFLPNVRKPDSFTQKASGNNGYVSDYYKNNKTGKRPPEVRPEKKPLPQQNKYNSQNSHPQNQVERHPNVERTNYNTNTNNIRSPKVVEGKKFFQSKIDFMAPVKSLQKKEHSILSGQLSDDSYQDNANKAIVKGREGAGGYQPEMPNNNMRISNKMGNQTTKVSQASIHNRSSSMHKRGDASGPQHKRTLNNSHIDNSLTNQYINLSQIKEENTNQHTSKRAQMGYNIGNSIISLAKRGNLNRQSNPRFQTKFVSPGSKSVVSNNKFAPPLGNSNTRGPVKSPLRLPVVRNFKTNQQRGGSTVNRGNQNKLQSIEQNDHVRLCSICTRKHNKNQPSQVQNTISRLPRMGQHTKTPVILNQSYNKSLPQNASHKSFRQKGRQRESPKSGVLSLNNSQRQFNKVNLSQIDRLRSVNKVRTIDNVNEYQRNPKSHSPSMRSISKQPSNRSFRVPSQIMGTPKRSPLLSNQKGRATFFQKKSLDASNEPELVCKEKELDPSIEEEIKEGFFELKQKFKEQGESSIYISHVVLHAKHPIFSKLNIDTLKTLLTESSVIYLSQDQVLYRQGSQDQFVYFVLFGKLVLYVPTPDEQQEQNMDNNDQLRVLGKANIGWALGEEVLFDKNQQIRKEKCVAEVESCLLGIMKSKLAIIQKNLLDKNNQKDYFVFESVLRGNFLIKNNWRKEYEELYSNTRESSQSQNR